MKKYLILAAVSILLFPFLAQADSGYSFKITIDQTAHDDYGLSYPLTYKFKIPESANNIVVSVRTNPSDSWSQIPIKTENNFFNGVEAVRFDYKNHFAYISVSFNADSNNIFLIFEDFQGRRIPGVFFIGTAEYYDDRKSAVVVSADDWDGYPERDLVFQKACDMMTAKKLWFTPGIVTLGMEGINLPDWKMIQSKIDAGYIEPASHSQRHLFLPYANYTKYKEEILGSKTDIINNLNLPALNKSGDKEYVYAWIEPYSRSDARSRTILGEAKYLFDRKAESSPAGEEFASWDLANGLYNKWETAISFNEKTLGGLNKLFDQTYSDGKIYHIYFHPATMDFSFGGAADQHFDYIKGKKDVWYAGLGHLYLYHYTRDRAGINVSAGDKSLASISNANFVNNEAPDGYFYPQEFDKLVLDITIPSGAGSGEDKLSAITIKSEGNAVNRNDIEKFNLWSDSGDSGFQGMGKDEELGVFEYDSDNVVWYLSGLKAVIPEQGLRIFVSADISKSATTGRFIQIKIPALSDLNNNGVFDKGDLGVFLESGNNGPIGTAIINSANQSIRPFRTSDDLAPKSVILDPLDNAIIGSESYVIKGRARDQGGSTPAWVKIEINDKWYDVGSTGANYSSWEYQWNNIAEKNHVIKVKSADWLGNEAIGDSIVITAQKKPAENPILPPENPKPAPEPAPAPSPGLTPIEQLKQQIEDLQQQIINLINQLIQLYLEEISSLS